MKIAHLTTVDLSLRYLLWPQLTAARDLGAESIGISAPGPWVDELEAAGIRHVPLRSSTRGWDLVRDVKAAIELWKILRRERPDILHTHNPKPGIYGRIVGRLAGVPVIVNTVHGLYATPDDPLAKRAAVYLLEALASRFSDAELIQSEEDLELLRRLRIVSPTKLAYLGNGIDLTRFDPARFSEEDRRRVRGDLGVGPDQVLVGSVGRLVAEKGFPELFEAMRRLDDRYVLAVAGPADPEKSDGLSAQHLAAAESAGIRLLGMRDDVDALYAAMDVFVLASHREGFPRSAMEASAMGLPVIATDIRGCREVVVHEETGLLVPVDDPASLAHAVRRLGEDPEERDRMGRSARKRAVEAFDERRIVETVVDTYRAWTRTKGLPFPLRRDRGITVRDAGPSDVSTVAVLHARSIAGGFLPSLGLGVLRELYRTMLEDPGSYVLVAVDDGNVVGFVAGSVDVGGLYRRFIRTRAWRAGARALPRLLVPKTVRKAWETLTYKGVDVGADAELLAMAVDPSARGRGIGKRLGRAFLDRAETAGVGAVRVVVGADNEVAIGAYRAMGFEPWSTIEVHAGEPSEVLVWRRS